MGGVGGSGRANQQQRLDGDTGTGEVIDRLDVPLPIETRRRHQQGHAWLEAHLGALVHFEGDGQAADCAATAAAGGVIVTADGYAAASATTAGLSELEAGNPEPPPPRPTPLAAALAEADAAVRIAACGTVAPMPEAQPPSTGVMLEGDGFDLEEGDDFDPPGFDDNDPDGPLFPVEGLRFLDPARFRPVDLRPPSRGAIWRCGWLDPPGSPTPMRGPHDAADTCRL